jgi:hypothetical protein
MPEIHGFLDPKEVAAVFKGVFDFLVDLFLLVFCREGVEVVEVVVLVVGVDCLLLPMAEEFEGEAVEGGLGVAE